jgi:crotonobetaine/carnitine-CoA ligase
MYEFLRQPSHWTLPDVLAWQAQERPSKTFVELVDGPDLSFGQAFEWSGQVASHFHNLGVRSGDSVIVMLPNDLDFVAVWLGLARLGAVAVLLNTELIGAFLEHQIVDSGAGMAVVAEPMLSRVMEISDRVPSLRSIVIAGTSDWLDARDTGLHLSSLAEWRTCGSYSGARPRAFDVAHVMYTSGTTGPAKGVLMPHAHCFLYGLGAIDNLDLNEDDKYYVTLPLYHANGLFMQVYGCLIAGATVVLKSRFSAQDWLPDIRRYRATLTNTLGVVAPFIFAQPRSGDDADHQLRAIVAAPNPAELQQIWQDRFGLSNVLSGFGMTEVNIPVWGRVGVETPPGAAGLVYNRYFEVQIVDPDSDIARPVGETGEIVVRPKAPFGFMAGYHGLPEKTVEAWRNLWFHTGDAGVMDQDGFIYFVDRIRDCIRRRGHNISSVEIENALLPMPGIVEVAAYGVPSEMSGGEDEIMITVVKASGKSLTPEAICSFSDEHLPRFAKIRYIRFVESLPKTSTGKVQKTDIRSLGIPVDVWDRNISKV